MSVLLALALALTPQALPVPPGSPAVTDDPLAYFPADTLLVTELNPGPWRRGGAATQAGRLLAHEGMRAFFAQFPLPPEIDGVFRNHRILFGLGMRDLEAGVALLVIEPLEGVEPFDPGAVFGEGAQGAWIRDGRRTLWMMPLAEPPGPQRAERWRQRLARVAERALEADGNAAAMPGMRALRSSLESDADLVRLYFPFDAWSLERFEKLLGIDEDEIPFDPVDLLRPLGMDRLTGFGWTVALDGELMRDRILLAGDHPMTELLGSPFAPGSDVLDRMAGMPGDATMASVSVMPLRAWIEAAEGYLDIVFDLIGSDWRKPEIVGWVETGKRIAAAAGEEIWALQRADDLWEGRNGALWYELPDPAEFRAALGELPPGVLALVQQGFDAGPGNYRFGLLVDGSRAYLARSLAEEPAEDTLSDSRAFRALRPWFEQQLAAGTAHGFGFVGPEVHAEGIDLLRRDGLPPELAHMLAFPVDFSTLPGFDEVAGMLGGGATVSRIDAAGLMLEMRSPLGYAGMILANPATLQALAQSLSGQPAFDLSAFEEF
jgi:hypothetical protein